MRFNLLASRLFSPRRSSAVRTDTRRSVLFGVSILLSLQGCTLDLVDPDLFAARFFTTLVLRPDGEGERFFLDANLEPGIGLEGRRAVPDPHLEINSSPRFPGLIAPGDPPAEYTWRNETGMTYTPGEVIRLRLPRVSGLPDPPDLELPAGIALIPALGQQLLPGEDLVFHLEPPTLSPSAIRWSISLVNLYAGPPFLLNAEGVGGWPEEIRIPSSHLPAFFTGVKATVRVIAEFSPEGAHPDYEILGRIDLVMERIVTRPGHIISSAAGAAQ